MFGRISSLVLTALAVLAVGCATLRPVNVPIDQVDLQGGYRPELDARDRTLGDVALLLAFSGGGTRASALSYGVLEELRDTRITVHGKSTRLLDEVDIITSVSGGSFTSAYYGLYGDRIFEDFDEKFLKRNVERGILLRFLLPQNWIRLPFSFFDRTEMTIRYYDKKIFDGARFADLTKAAGPLIQINSTDLSVGSRFTFVQPTFDIICSDLSKLEVARAVTASSAVPIIFPAVTLRNYAGTCGYEKPAWLDEALASRETDPRRHHIASEMTDYLDPKKASYIHLVDGGISDNLGIRGTIDNVIVEGGIYPRLGGLGVEPPSHIIFIVVNASTAPDRGFPLLPAPPSLSAVLGSITDTQLHRYNFETLELLRESMREVTRDMRSHGDPVKTHVIELAEYQLENPDDREFFDNVPTSLGLDDETVDRLVAIARQLLRQSDEFQEAVAELGADHREP